MIYDIFGKVIYKYLIKTKLCLCYKVYQFVSLDVTDTTNMRSDKMFYLYSKWVLCSALWYMSGFTFERFRRYILSYILLLVKLLFVIYVCRNKLNGHLITLTKLFEGIKPKDYEFHSWLGLHNNITCIQFVWPSQI